jgi:hypothetical protein
MKTTLLALLSVLVLAGCASDRFELVDPSTNQAIGPFLYRSGASVQIDGKEYRIRRLVSRDEFVEDRMKSTIIPELDFRDAAVADIAQFLSESGIVFDDSKAIVNPRVQVTVLVPKERMPEIPKVTFSARYISQYRALEITAKLTDLDFVIEDGLVWLKWKE